MKKSIFKIILLVETLLFLFLLSCKNKELSESDFKFDGPLGSEGARIERLGKNYFRVSMGHPPNHPEWSNMLNFQITGNAKGNDLSLIVDGPSRYPVNSYFYSWSYDMKQWNPVHWKAGSKLSPGKDTLIFPVFKQNQVWVGNQVPISYDQIEEFISIIAPSEYVNVDTLGKSLGGLNLYRLTITDASSTIQKNKKWVHYFTNPHPGEHNAQWRMMGMIEWLLSNQGDDFRRRSICHFILMMSPDAPHKGWYRVNGQGIDMNRSYSPGGADKDKQAHEAYIFQKDLELIMTSESPVTTLWGMHTWAGIVEPLVYFIQDERLSTWTAWRDILLELDQDTLIKPLALREKSGYGPTSWEYGAHTHLGITTILCEGAGALYTEEENKNSGKLLIESLAKYYKGVKN